ncbi:hypothetical protein ACFSSA_02205 [Luteolibacter algae]|uniref:Uncharacterized protein n=1 Tax=Luteolibacter algae TaxID=454151 RepID=A0ABW5D3V4_9BACT
MYFPHLCSAMLLASSLPLLAIVPEKTLVNYFLAAEPVEPLVSEGIWGDGNVLPRDIRNGLEDPDMDQWCYWDGSIVKADDGRYFMYASRWDQKFHHGTGWTENSKAMISVSDKMMGPYADLGEAWPEWKNWNGDMGSGHNTVGLRMHDGRYAMVTSEITMGEVFAAKDPAGPFECLGRIKVDYNGFHPGLARYNFAPYKMANVMILPIENKRYMLMGRNCAVMISDDGVTGPYRMMGDQIWKDLDGVPQKYMEDPTIWRSDGLFHVVVNHYATTDLSYHLTSEDGIHDWKNRGIAMSKEDGGIFRYTNGVRNEWYTVQRPTVYVEDGTVRLFNFSVIDVHKGKDDGNDKHGSKVVLVPFDGEAFGRDMRALVSRENEIADQTAPPVPWVTDDIGNAGGNSGFDAKVKTVRLRAGGGLGAESADTIRFLNQKQSGDVVLTAQVLSQDYTPDAASAGIMFRKSLDQASASIATMIVPGKGLVQYLRSRDGEMNQVGVIEKLRAPYFLKMIKRDGRIETWISQTDRHN